MCVFSHTMAARPLILSALGARRLPDDNVFDRTLRGDPVAFSEVYRRYHKRIYGYCLARSLDPETAADATQEVFMKLLRAEPGSVDHPRAWLFTVARNVVIDAARKRSRTPEDPGIDEESLAWDRLKSADTANEVLARSDARNVFLALRSLRPRYRAALIMREVHGQTARDMAEAFETTPGAVDTLVSRARDAFGSAYAAIGDLPSACRASVELIYRKHGTGISPEEDAGLQAHLAGCDRCRGEAKKADDPRHLSALLPFLVPAKHIGYGLLERAALTARSVPGVAVQHTGAVLTQPHTWNLAAKITAGVLATTLVVAPIAGIAAVHHLASAPASATATGPSPQTGHPRPERDGRAKGGFGPSGTSTGMWVYDRTGATGPATWMPPSTNRMPAPAPPASPVPHSGGPTGGASGMASPSTGRMTPGTTPSYGGAGTSPSPGSGSTSMGSGPAGR